MAASTLEMNASPLPDKLLPSILTDVVEFVFYGGSENRILIKKSKAGSISLLTYMAVVLICKWNLGKNRLKSVTREMTEELLQNFILGLVSYQAALWKVKFH